MWGRFHCTHTRHRILFQGLWIFPPQTKSQLHIQRSQRCSKLAEGHVYLKLIVMKRDHIRGFPLRGPFFVGSILIDVSDKELNSLCEIQLFVPSFEDCPLFRLHGRVSIHRDGIVGKVGEGHFQRDKCSQTERGIV